MNDLAEVTFAVSATARDAVTNYLTERVASGVEQRDQDTLEKPEAANTVELVVWLPSSNVSSLAESVGQLVDSLRQMGTEIDAFAWRTEESDPKRWADVYKEYFKVHHITPRLVIRPSWETYEAKNGECIIELDPGMAFGTGLHASTRLAARAMERLSRMHAAPKRILDLGCGTGILAIGAARLWPSSRITAVDLDQTSVEICRENVARNKLTNKIHIEQRLASDVVDTYDLILANLTRDLLFGLSESLPGRTDPEGRVVLSGLLADQAAEIANCYAENLRFVPEYSEEEQGWRAVTMRRQ